MLGCWLSCIMQSFCPVTYQSFVESPFFFSSIFYLLCGWTCTLHNGQTWENVLQRKCERYWVYSMEQIGVGGFECGATNRFHYAIYRMWSTVRDKRPTRSDAGDNHDVISPGPVFFLFFFIGIFEKVPQWQTYTCADRIETPN